MRCPHPLNPHHPLPSLPSSLIIRYPHHALPPSLALPCAVLPVRVQDNRRRSAYEQMELRLDGMEFSPEPGLANDLAFTRQADEVSSCISLRLARCVPTCCQLRACNKVPPRGAISTQHPIFPLWAMCTPCSLRRHSPRTSTMYRWCSSLIPSRCLSPTGSHHRQGRRRCG